jgi:hypothetical protein
MPLKTSLKITTEFQMALAVASGFKYVTRELKVAECIFDVVAYDKTERLFTLVECKLGTKPTSIGHAFGQIAAYSAILCEHGRAFLKAFTKRVPLNYERQMEATDEGRRFRVAFYVALSDSACKRVELIRSVKKLLPTVGIIRVKPDGKCRPHLHVNGRKDSKLATASPTLIDILPSATAETSQGQK